MKTIKLLLLIIALIGLQITVATGQNPFIQDQFTADPTARVFNSRVYFYPSHDIPAQPGRGRAGWSKEIQMLADLCWLK